MDLQKLASWSNKLDDEERIIGLYIRAVNKDNAHCILCDKKIQSYLLKIVDHIKSANHQENLRFKHQLIEELGKNGNFFVKFNKIIIIFISSNK